MSSTLSERVYAVEVKSDNNEKEIKSVGDRLNRLLFWMMATFGGVTTAVLLLLVQFALKK